MESKNVRTLHGGGAAGPIKPKITASKTVFSKPKIAPKAGGSSKPKPTPPVRLGGGYIVGRNLNDNRWRCQVCTFLNEPEYNECKMCGSQKGEQKSKKVGAPKGAVGRAGPTRSSVPVKTIAKPAPGGIQKAGISRVNIGGPSMPSTNKS